MGMNSNSAGVAPLSLYFVHNHKPPTRDVVAVLKRKIYIVEYVRGKEEQEMAEKVVNVMLLVN